MRLGVIALAAFAASAALLHHGVALSGDGRTICNAGTIDDYIAMVDRATFSVKRLVSGFAKPYWAETSRDGTKCLVAKSDGDCVSVMDFVTGAEVQRTPVGSFPQRERNGRLDTTIVLSPNAG